MASGKQPHTPVRTPSAARLVHDGRGRDGSGAFERVVGMGSPQLVLPERGLSVGVYDGLAPSSTRLNRAVLSQLLVSGALGDFPREQATAGT